MKKLHTKDFLGKFSITFYSVIALAMLGLLSSCQSEEDLESSKNRSTFLEFNITMPLASVTTSQGYENGTKEENSISDYRIFIYDTDNKYIMSLDDPSFSIEDTDLNTIYTITAEITDDEGNNPLDGYSDFKIVMLANWETYTEPQKESTIDDLCNSEYAQYSAFTTNDFNLSGKHIPFYGVHEYTGVTFPKDGTVYLNGNLTLLRAMAKVEIIIDCEDDEDDNITLSSATIHNYNSKGYSAPANVYSQDDYGQATNWASDYTGENIHLVGDKNDSGEKSLSLYKVQDKLRDVNNNVIQKETWIAYVPEYDNQSTDFSYIDIVLTNKAVTRDTQYRIYFALYDDDGTTKAYDSDASEDEKAKRRDIHRNNLYRFNVDFDLYYNLKVNVQDWEQVFENDFTFGDLSHVIFKDTESTDGPGYFWVDGVMFQSQVDEENYQEGDALSAYIKLYEINEGQDSYTIPSQIYYLGYTYTITGIGDYCFQADTWLSTIVIPSSITYIGKDAFYGDSNLTTLIVQCTEPPECDEDAFEGDDVENMVLIVPEGTKEAYQNDDVWKTFGTITEVSM